MSLSPWDLSGAISFDFSLYRPRRPSYVYATQITRRRNESYRSATKSESTHGTGFDYIEDVAQQSAKSRSQRELRDGANPSIYDSNNITVNGENGRERCYPTTTPVAIIEGSEDDCRVTITITEPSIDIDYEDDDDYYDDHDGASVSNSIHTNRTKSLDGQSTQQSIYSRSNSQVSKWKYIKNFTVLSLSFILVFSAFRSIQNLQTSLNSKRNLGFITMGCVHGTMFLTCLFTPVLVNKLTSKWTIVLGLIFYLFWIAANFYPHFYTLIPTSIGVGFGQSLAWGAQVTYLQQLSIDYAYVSKELSQQELARFNGVFLACFQTTHVWGNLVSSLMLKPPPPAPLLMFGNSSDMPNMQMSMPSAAVYCGVYDSCSSSGVDMGADMMYEDVPLFTGNSSDLDSLPVGEHAVNSASDLVLKLMGSYLVFAFVGFVLIFFLLDKIGAKSELPEKTCLQMVLANVHHLCNHKTYRLLVPLLLFNGFEQGFVYADYTKSYISCTVGVEYVGYNMITLGITNVVFSVLVGIVVKHVPREAIIGIGSVLHLSLMVFLLVWIPDQNLLPVFFVISALWGICDAIWQTQCNTLVNISCHEDHDVGFQNFRMLQGLGATIAFALGSVICVEVKLYIIITLLILAIMCYVVAEYRIRSEEERQIAAATSAHNNATRNNA